ncbi:MAG: hypothetical protein ACLSA6_16155 [Holdemania massiliensis]
MFDILIRGGLIVDGTESQGRLAMWGLLGTGFVRLEIWAAVRKAGNSGKGKVITPGFIDPHSHLIYPFYFAVDDELSDAGRDDRDRRQLRSFLWPGGR